MSNADEMVTIEFTDIESGDTGVAVVRRVGDGVALCISTRLGSDVEVVVDQRIAVAIGDSISRLATSI